MLKTKESIYNTKESQSHNFAKEQSKQRRKRQKRITENPRNGSKHLPTNNYFKYKWIKGTN